MSDNQAKASKQRFWIGAVIAAGFVAALVGYAQFDGAKRADEGRRDPTALQEVRETARGEKP